jgi:membrane-bound ClpP family serine protease
MRLELGLASHLASDRAELANALEVAASAISDRAFLPDATKAVIVKLEGPIHHHAVSWIMRSLEERLATDTLNLVVLNLQSAGGNLQESLRLADYLARGLPNRDVRSIAVVTEARGDAALVAFACDEIVMTENALLGGPGAATIRPRRGFSLRESVQSLAKARQRDWSLAVALVDESLEVYRYQRTGGTTVRYLSAEEAEALSDADLWERGRPIDLRGGMSAPVAVETGLARYAAADFTDVLRRERLEDAPVLLPGAVFVFVEWLADKRLAGILLFVAFVALVIEMNTPGVGIMGFTSALCFLLYFWSQFLHGNATALEILLFLGGVTCILAEFFVVPGTAIFGLGGALMMLASIILASQTFIIPMNVYQLREMPSSLYMVILALVGCAGAVALLRQFLPQTPYFNRMILPPPDGELREQIERREALAAFDHLLGKPGIATTPLVPAGKALFGDELVDVLSEGELIEKGRAVFVAAVRGNHVIVKASDR